MGDRIDARRQSNECRDIKSGSIGIIHLAYLPLCSLRSLWLNHSGAAGFNIFFKYKIYI